MATFLDNQSDARRMAALLAEYDRRLQALERTTQASRTSIEGGALPIYAKDGTLRGSVGIQPDGTVAVVPHNSTPPPTPTTPTVEPVLAGLVINWDGLFADSYTTPADFSHIQVHLGGAADFTPDAGTLAATITGARGGTVTVATASYAAVHVRLVAANTAGQPGPPSASVAGTPRQVDGPDLSKLLDLAVWLKDGSIPGSKLVAQTIGADLLAANAVVAGKIDAGAIKARELAAQSVEATHIRAGQIEATHLKAGAITADKLALGTTGNVIPDASFEGEVTAARVAESGGSLWAVVSGGNNSAKSLQVSAAASEPTTRGLRLVSVPVLPGEALYLAVDYQCSTDWAGESVKVYAHWVDGAGKEMEAWGVVEAKPPVRDGTWQRLAGQVKAPDQAVRANVAVETFASTAGTVRFDNAEARPVIGGRDAGARAELSPQGLRLFDRDGQEAVALTADRPNYLTFASAGTPVATIDQRGSAGFQDLAVAGSLSVGGDPLTRILDRLPRGIQAIDYQASVITSTGTEMGFVELAFNSEPGRTYRIVLDCFCDPSVAGGELQIRFRDGGASTPSITSPQMQWGVWPMRSDDWMRVRLEHVFRGDDLMPGLHRFLSTFRNVNGPGGQTVTLRGHDTGLGLMYIEDLGPHVPETGIYNNGGGTTTRPVQQYTRTYPAAWSGSYANRGSYNSYYGNAMMQGYISSTNGTQASLVGFPSSLTSDLSGAKIQKAELFLYFEHWYYNDGGTAVIKAHSHAARPSSFSCDSQSMAVGWGKNVGKWVDITSIFDSTSWRGIALDPNNTSLSYYGRARGYGQDNPPQLRVTYTK
ncbi:hypothetical protein ACFV98_02905 [Streptomyces violascens]|uniref:hypothetical protein n=1 Tax=Streptomyces violascens TaxID=67381 RepID=UPI0036494D80